jgi:protein-tyrosine phosphatase
MTKIRSLIGLSALALPLALIASTAPAFARAESAAVERTAPDKVTVSWTAKGPVDLFWADHPVSDPALAKLVSAKDRDGRQEVTVDTAVRPYFLIRDQTDGAVVDVAERVVPLEQGSNFRDIGGYQGADGKHVRWGLIYRSGATAMLTPGDVARVRGLGLHNLVDLRSSEERVLAPTRIDGVPYAAVGYSMAEILRMASQGPTGGLYGQLPTMLVPQMRLVFDALKRHEGPIAYNCSAGQDRTGFATAMVLSALGVPRDTIVKDYHLSTTYRHPEWEMPPINAAAFPDNQVAQFFARNQGAAAGRKPQPLYDANGKSLLLDAFAAIDTKYGSVDAYLEKEVGVTAADIAALRANYLE